MRHPVFHFLLFSYHFLLIFPIFQTRQHIFCFLSLYLILLSLFCFFIVLTFFFSLRHASLPLHLPGLPFSLFFACNFTFFPILNAFYSFPLLFSPLTAILQLLLPFRCFSRLFFLLFRPSLTAFASFQPFFFLFSAHFYLFFYFLSIPPFLALFSPFFSFSSIFSFLLMSLFQARFFTFHTPQNVSRETSFFTISGLQRSVKSDLLFLFPKITLVFCLSNF